MNAAGKVSGVTRLIAEEFEDHLGQTRFRHFFPSLMQLRMCSADEARLYEVEIAAGTHSDPGGYWGWWENEGRRWAWVFGSKVQCEVCFPYGSKAEEERGRGWMLPVDVKVIGAAQGGSNG